jgi:four helix bundle protein
VANLEEAKSAYSRRDLAAKYTVALRESRECHDWLRLVKADQPKVSAATDPLIDETEQFVAMLTTAVIKLSTAKQSPDDRQAPGHFSLLAFHF